MPIVFKSIESVSKRSCLQTVEMIKEIFLLLAVSAVFANVISAPVGEPANKNEQLNSNNQEATENSNVEKDEEDPGYVRILKLDFGP